MRTAIAFVATTLLITSLGTLPSSADGTEEICEGNDPLDEAASAIGVTGQAGAGYQVFATRNQFMPSCLVVPTGSQVSWTNVNGAPVDPQSLQDGGDCFWATSDMDPGANEPQGIAPGERYSVTFHWDGERLSVEIFDGLGEPLATRHCEDAVSGVGPDGHAFIPYQNYLWWQTQGTVVVAP